MEKRAVIAALLSVAVFFLFQTFFAPPAPVTPKPGEVAKNMTGISKTVSAPAAPTGALPASTAKTPEASAQFAQIPEKDISIETDTVSAVISTRGGLLKSWKLKKYKNDKGMPIQMDRPGGFVLPLQLTPSGMDLATSAAIPFTSDKESLTLKSSETGDITLTYTGATGQTITKKLTFRGSDYAVNLQVSTSGISSYTIYTGDGFGSVTPVEDKNARKSGFVGAIALLDDDKKKIDPAKLDKETLYSGVKGWAGVTDKYFLGALIPKGEVKAYVSKGLSGEGLVGLTEAKATAEFMFYAGPKEYDSLKAFNCDLERAVDFGWFTWFAKPLFMLLKLIHGYVVNWGWAIIILTFIVKLLFAPLTHKQQKSMKRMQKLQPMMAELKEKHGSDPARLNKEMMDLYSREKVNPMSGCLPMVVQIPVFIALYNVLNNSIELRGAPFALWLMDLSTKDPYYVLPVLMGASMILTQKLSPSTADPKQNMIMMGMSVFMTFMFLNLPSGLVLYFVVSNLLSIAQQLYTNKTITE